jgi:hypothetical protein
MALGLGGQSVYIGHMQGKGPGVVELEGVQVSCPRCGSMGSIPNGTYDFVRKGMRLLRDLTPQQSRTLAESLRQFQADPSTEIEVDDALPEDTKAFLLSVFQKADKKFWAGILVGMLAVVLGYLGTKDIVGAIGENRAVATQQFQQLDENDRAVCQELAEIMKAVDANRPVAARTPPARAVPPPTSTAVPAELPNKNDSCWCGSGRKFKRCHLTEAG